MTSNDHLGCSISKQGKAKHQEGDIDEEIEIRVITPKQPMLDKHHSYDSQSKASPFPL